MLLLLARLDGLSSLDPSHRTYLIGVLIVMLKCLYQSEDLVEISSHGIVVKSDMSDNKVLVNQKEPSESVSVVPQASVLLRNDMALVGNQRIAQSAAKSSSHSRGLGPGKVRV